MASLVKVGDVYHCSFRFGGTQFKPSLDVKNRREAENQLAQIEETIRLLKTGRLAIPAGASREETRLFICSGGKLTEKPIVTESYTLCAVIDAYFEASSSDKESSTVAGERIHTTHFLRLLGENTPLDRINTDVLREYAAKRQKEPGQNGKTVSPRTVEKEFRTWSQIWKFAVEQQIVTGESPHKAVRLARSDQPLPFKSWTEIELIIKRGNLTKEQQKAYWDCLFLDEDQVLELLQFFQANARHPFIHPAVAIAAFTGARRSEIIRSEIEDWDFERAFVRLRGRKDSRTHRTTQREVFMHPRLREIMEAWFNGPHPGGRYSIAVMDNGEPRPITESQAHHHFKTTLSGSKWEVIRGWHVLRHSFCSNCARRGVSDPIIDRWMGHQGNEAVKQRYRHFFTSDQQDYMNRLFA